jgi:pyruvate kinase
MARDPILDEVFSRRLMVKRIAEATGISTAAVSQWRRVPKRHLAVMSAITGLPAHTFRPDLSAADDAVAA